MHRFGIRTSSGAATIGCLLALAAGCGEQAARVPPACTNGSDAVLAALRAAPAPVRLDGTRVSECMTQESDGGDLQTVGMALVESATTLATAARRDPEGREALELGYLVAAAHRGGDRTQGVHGELLRRLDQEAAPFEGSRAYRRGARAGRASG